MILIIAEPGDTPAYWLRERLCHHVAVAVAMVTPTQLACSRSMEHRLSTSSSSSRFALVSGVEVASGELTAVVNRLGAVPTAQFARASASDREYAAQELHAFLLGWLASMERPVLNRPTPASLSGGWHGALELEHLAAHCGLPTGSASAKFPVRSHFALDGRLFGPIVPADTRDALLQLAALYGSELLQLDVAVGEAGPKLVRVDSLVDYRLGGELLVRAIARRLAP